MWGARLGSVVFAAACAVLACACDAPCPSGYRREHDQCVKKLPHPCTVLPPSKLDDNGDDLMSRVDLEATGDCFWMDQTEVSVNAYAKWVKDEPAPSSWEDRYCTWKTTRNDPRGDASVCDAPLAAHDQDPWGASKPIRCVDFCDAEAFCRYRGAHLCHDLAHSNGTTGPRSYTREWPTACSNDGATIYPWGNENDASRCQTGQADNGCTDNHCGPVAVGQRMRCRTQADVFDLIGNVMEWTYACVDFDPDDPVCLVRGGTYDTPSHACLKETFLSNAARRPDVGFRCCQDLDASERGMLEREEDAP